MFPSASTLGKHNKLELDSHHLWCHFTKDPVLNDHVLVAKPSNLQKPPRPPTQSSHGGPSTTQARHTCDDEITHMCGAPSRDVQQMRFDACFRVLLRCYRHHHQQARLCLVSCAHFFLFTGADFAIAHNAPIQ